MLYELYLGKKKKREKLAGMVAHICDLNIWEIRVGGLRMRPSPGIVRSCLKRGWQC